MAGNISVTISLGPRPEHARWLEECIRSVAEQTVAPSEVLVIDDMHGLSEEKRSWYQHVLGSVPFRVYETPWNVGCVCACNFGVALAASDAVVLLASDDMLGPHAIERCAAIWARFGHKDAYYWFDCHMIDENGDWDGQPDQSVASGPAMVTKGLWRATGGYPPESSVGHSDTILLNCFIVNDVPMGPIEHGLSDPSYIARMHPQADHSQRWDNGWGEIIKATRDLMPNIWNPPAWGRMA